MRRELRRRLGQFVTGMRVRRTQKVFCVGSNKTGTTSVERALKDLGYVVGVQRKAELLIGDWVRRDFSRILRLCRSAEAFQDIPFSLPFTYQALDAQFPGSKFILTVRDSPDQWYKSLTRFHSKMFGAGDFPNSEDLKNAEYCYLGWAYETIRALYPTEGNDIYNEEILKTCYAKHNEAVAEYFRHREGDLLVINVAENGAYRSLCEFLGKECGEENFPWENKTSDITARTV